MNVDLTQEQAMLKESLARRFAAAAGLRSLTAQERWQAYAEAGLLGMLFSEDVGGLGAGPVETMVFMEEVGRAQVHDPFLSTVVLSGELLRQLPAHPQPHPQAQALVEAIVAGHATVAFAHWEAPGRGVGEWVDTQARRVDGGWVLSGEKVLVTDGSGASRIIVSAQTDGPDRLGLFLVDPQDPAVQIDTVPCWDGHASATVRLEQLWVGDDALLGEAGAAWPAIRQAVDMATAAVCAEAVGAMAGAFDLTTDYLRTRRQFKAPLASFQALRHRAVDMLMALDLARSATMAAASACQHGDAHARQFAVARAKVMVNRSARCIGQSAVQLHGAIGLTEEYQLGAYFRRLTVIGQLYGDEHHHLRWLANAEPVAPHGAAADSSPTHNPLSIS